MQKTVMDIFGSQVDDSIRLRLLAEEQKLRKKQPEPWTKTKYRAYANFKAKKKTEELISEITKIDQTLKTASIKATVKPIKTVKRIIKKKN